MFNYLATRTSTDRLFCSPYQELALAEYYHVVGPDSVYECIRINKVIPYYSNIHRLLASTMYNFLPIVMYVVYVFGYICIGFLMKLILNFIG